jgi:predicted O-methyltransferase YrrM
MDGQWVTYVAIERAEKMVRAINEAKTEREHRDAELRCEGYKMRCRETGFEWPAVQLDAIFTDEWKNDRPVCCGEYLDWAPTPD